MLRNLVLDWSGTLVDDYPPTLAATNAIFRQYERPEMSDAEFRAAFRLPYPDFYNDHLPEVSLDDLEVIFKREFLASEHLVSVLPGTIPMLSTARQKGIRTFVLTSMNEEAFTRQAEAFGLFTYLEGFQAGVLDKRRGLAEFISRYGLLRSETAYVGDMTHDVESARENGLHAIAVTSGYQSASQLHPAGPDYILPDVSYLSPLFGERTLRADIQVKGLQVETHIGVPAEEREHSQVLLFDLQLQLGGHGILGCEDKIERTLNYDTLCRAIRRHAAGGERKLIETLAEETAQLILREFAMVDGLQIRIRKGIIPNCESVAVETMVWR